MKNSTTIIISVLILNFILIGTNAQISKTDSLENMLLQHTKKDTIRVNLLNDVAFDFYKKDLDKTLQYVQEALKLAESLAYKKGIARSFHTLGIWNWKKGNYPEAVESYQKAVEIREKLGDKGGASVSYNGIGVIYHSQGNYPAAIEYYQKALKIQEELVSKKGASDTYNNLGVIHYFQGNYPTALEYLKKSAKLNEEQGDTIEAANAYHNVGLIYYSQGNYPIALKYYQKALKIREILGDKSGIADSYFNIGVIYKRRGNYPTALEYYQKALKTYDELGIKNKISSSYNNIGIIYSIQGDYTKAYDYYQKALRIYEEIGDKSGISSSYNKFGGIYKYRGDYPAALEYYQKALKIREELGDKSGIADSYFKIGIIYKNQGNYIKAYEAYQKSLKISIEIGEKSAEGYSYNGLASLYFKQNKTKKAHIYSKKAFALAEETGETDLLKESSEILAKSSEVLGLYKEAYKYHVIFKTMSDSIYNENNIKEITNLENQYAFNKEKETIATEQAKKDAVQSAEMKRQKQLRNAFIGGAIIFLILAIIIMRNLIQKRKANHLLVEKNEEIETQAEELKATNDKLLELDQFKEGMTGMIVHDLKNPLNAIINAPQSFSLEKQNANMKQSGKQMLNMVLNILDVHKYEDTRMTVDKVDHSLFELSQNAINEVSFLAKQKSIAITNSITTQLGVKCDKEVTERVFVNLLTNAIKYTPNNGAITLSANEPNDKSGLVKVQVTDSGQGIPKDKLSTVFDKFGQVSAKQSGGVRSTGLGLTFCKMAVEAHGGEISVESEIKNLPAGKVGGTSFIFTLPLGTEFEKVMPNEKPIQSKPKLILSNKDKELLKPYAKELSSLMVYQTSNVKKILDSIDYEESEVIENWINEVRHSLFAMNEERFNNLINQIINI